MKCSAVALLPVYFLVLSAFAVGQSDQTQATQPSHAGDPGSHPRLIARPSVTVAPSEESSEAGLPATNTAPRKIPLILPRGTPIRVALSKRVRVGREGAPLEGKVTDAVYAFDRVVVPAGSEVHGRVVRVKGVSPLRRSMAIANGDLTPRREFTVSFDSISLPGGQRLPVATVVGPGTENVVHLVSDSGHAAKKNLAAKTAGDMKHEASGRFHQAMAYIKSPGRMQRVKQFFLAQLPYRRQYLEPGTRFNADLDEPLAFGSEKFNTDQLSSVGTQPAADSTIHARLTAEVSSATAHRGTKIEALVTQPVFNSRHQLVLPADSRILGEVTQAKPASKLHHNGDLRVTFERIVTPEGEVQVMHGSLEGVEVDRAANMKLDAEGGAHATDSKSRYVSTSLAILVAAAASHPEDDDGASDGASDPAARTAAGGSGFKLVGAVVSLASNSKVFSSALGAYGASMSVYSHFLSRGKDVVLPKDTPVEISLGRSQSGMSQAMAK